MNGLMVMGATGRHRAPGRSHESSFRKKARREESGVCALRARENRISASGLTSSGVFADHDDRLRPPCPGAADDPEEAGPP